MNIGITTDTLEKISGKERVVIGLAKEFAKMGENVTVITFEDRADKSIIEKLNSAGVEVKFAGKYVSKIYSRKNYLKYKKAIEKMGLDVINAHGLILANAASLSRVPTVKTYHAHVTTLDAFLENPLRWTSWYFEESLSIYLSEALVSVSNFAKKQLSKIYPLSKDSEVIYHGLSEEFFKEKKKKIPEDKENIVIGSISRLVKSKNVQIIPKIAKRVKNAKFVVGGYGPLEGFMKKSAEKIPNLEFIGYVENVIEFYDSIDILLHTSRHESFGFPLLEAQARGKPVVAFNTTAIPEIVINGKTGLLAKDVEEMIKYLRSLIDDEQLREEMGREARKFAKNFTWEKAASRYLKTFRNIYSIK